MILDKVRRRIDDICTKYNDKIALRYYDKEACIEKSFFIVHERILKFKNIVDKYNLKPGDRIGLVSSNNSIGTLLFLCATYWNITVVFIDSTFAKDQLISLIEFSNIKALFIGQRHYDYYALDLDIPTFNVYKSSYPLINENYKIKECLNVDENVCAIICSSGTAGSLKAVEITYDSFFTNIDHGIKIVKCTDDDTFFTIFPIAHLSGFIPCLISFFSGATQNTVDDYDIKKLNEYLLKINPTHFCMVPRVFDLMIDAFNEKLKYESKLKIWYYNFAKKVSKFFQIKFHNRKIGRKLLFPFSSKMFGNNIKVVLSGAGKSSQKISDFFNYLGLAFINLYASTECGLVITAVSYDDYFQGESEGSVDTFDDVKVIIANPNDEGIGEIRVKSSTMMKGYFKDADATKKAFDDKAYFKTGDLGYIDDKRYLHVVGRIKEAILLQNGKKVSPEDLEKLLKKVCPKDNPVVICGVRNRNDSYDKIHAFYLDKNYTDDEKKRIKKDLLTEARIQLKIASITRVHFVDNIPCTRTHKIKRNELIKKIENEETENLTDINSIISNYVDMSLELKPDDRLVDLGLDSLSILSIANEIKNIYGINIIPKLSENVRVKDLLEEYDNNVEVSLRKIRKDEIDKVSKLLTDAFIDYPVYTYFYKNLKRRNRQLFYDNKMLILSDFDNVYVNENCSIALGIITPESKTKILFLEIIKPSFLIPYIFNCLLSLPKTFEYLKIAKSKMKKYSNPKTDCYISFGVTDPNKRGNGDFLKLAKLMEGKRIYIDTQIKKNDTLYEKLGFEVCEKFNWHGMDFYCMFKNK